MPKESYEDMRTYHVEVITHPDRLPELPSDNFFHSAQLFSVLYDTPGVKPFMTVAYDEKHTVRGHMLGIMLLPPHAAAAFYVSSGSCLRRGRIC